MKRRDLIGEGVSMAGPSVGSAEVAVSFIEIVCLIGDDVHMEMMFKFPYIISTLSRIIQEEIA
jgi:hypothetical protein